jgi:hypothetical protein
MHNQASPGDAIARGSSQRYNDDQADERIRQAMTA